MLENAKLHLFDPKVTETQIMKDLATPKFEWDHPRSSNGAASSHYEDDAVVVFRDPYEACKDAHALAIMTEWDEFKAYDYEKIYSSMMKPAFIFDG